MDWTFTVCYIITAILAHARRLFGAIACDRSGGNHGSRGQQSCPNLSRVRADTAADATRGRITAASGGVAPGTAADAARRRIAAAGGGIASGTATDAARRRIAAAGGGIASGTAAGAARHGIIGCVCARCTRNTRI